MAPDPRDLLRSDDTDATDGFDDEFEPKLPIEPETPALENALFVLLGVLVALAVIARLVQLFG